MDELRHLVQAHLLGTFAEDKQQRIDGVRPEDRGAVSSDSVVVCLKVGSRMLLPSNKAKRDPVRL